MLEFKFEIDGKSVAPGDLVESLESMMLKSLRDRLYAQLSNVRDPDTGEFPVVVIRGRSMENLSIEITGSERIQALVKERLAQYGTVEPANMPAHELPKTAAPCAFLCHATEDKALAERIARELMANGIDVFFDTWSIGDGESIRQKIDQGLLGCTHFIALLTPRSIAKPWVNAEMDGAFVRSLERRCRFIPLRYELDAAQLPPLLSGLLSPVLADGHADLGSLINRIHGVSEKPPLGPAPLAVRASTSRATGLSPGAEMIVRLMMAKTEHGDAMDPQIEADDLRRETGLSDDDIIDAVDELESLGYVRRLEVIGGGTLGFPTLMSEAALFVAMDKHFTEWVTEQDALKVAADLQNDVADGWISKLAEVYGWTPRRMNPAVNFLIECDLVDASQEVGCHPWTVHWIAANARTRRFVRDRG